MLEAEKANGDRERRRRERVRRLRVNKREDTTIEIRAPRVLNNTLPSPSPSLPSVVVVHRGVGTSDWPLPCAGGYMGNLAKALLGKSHQSDTAARAHGQNLDSRR